MLLSESQGIGIPQGATQLAASTHLKYKLFFSNHLRLRTLSQGASNPSACPTRFSFKFFHLLRRLPVYCHINMKNVWKNFTLPFHFDHLPTQVPRSPYWLQGFESVIICAHFCFSLAPTEPFVSKKSKKIKFVV